MPKVLMIDYGAYLRTEKFAKYLPKYGWHPIILRLKNPGLFGSVSKECDKLEDVEVYPCVNILHLEIPAGALRRLGTSYRFIVLPDIFIGWIPMALRKGMEILKKRNIDIIYASCPPYSSALVGAILKKKTGKPLVVDMRDAWTLNPLLTSYPTLLHKRIDRYIEKRVLESCDQLITVTNGIKDDYLAIYPWLKEKTTVIRHGFDADDFPGNCKPFDKFTITYTGSFYGSRYPELFLAGLRKVLDENRIPRDNINVMFVGSKRKELSKMVKHFALHDVIACTSRIPRKEAIEYACKSHLLLLVVTSNALTTKTYEYLVTGNPILAIVPQGELEQLIREHSDNSYITQDVDKIADAIVDAYTKWSKGELHKTKGRKIMEYMSKYTRENQTKELIEVFERALAR
ncbi:hypothetical protein ES703_73973 [subsurface metagenome]